MKQSIPRIAFLFTNSREEIISKVRTGEDADTALRGLNHIKGAEHLTVSPKSIWAVLLLPRLLRYDFIIAQDNLLLGYMVSICARALRLKTRWLYVAINSSTLMRRHADHPVRLFLLKRFWASYTRIVCLSSEQIDDFVRLGIAREHLDFIPFGVDARFFQSAADSSQEEDLVVSVGRDAGRDYETLFKAAEHTNHSFVVVVGHKNIPLGTSIPPNVSVLYNRSLSEVRDLYRRARLVVVVSKEGHIPEGSDCSGQTVVLDALAAGKAVIATHRSWVLDYFTPDEDLVVVAPGDSRAIAHAIDSLSQDAERRKRLAASGRGKVIARYTTQTFAESLLTLMNTII